MDKTREGFTLIELTIALAFISVLLILVVVVTINMIGLYTKGQTIKNVNETGRSLIDDMRRTLNDVTPFDTQVAIVTYPQAASNLADKTGGRFCTGAYTYAWNTPAAYNHVPPDPPNKYATGDQRLSVVKVVDPNGTLCTSGKNTSNVIADDPNQTTVLVAYDELYIYDFAAFSTKDKSSNQALYLVSFVLGTSRGVDSKEMLSNNAQCAPPSNIGKDFNYCSVNRFDFTTRSVK